jgi:hypothetical protein
MPGHDNIAAPHADRYGHPEAVNLRTLTPGSYEHGVDAAHCDRYGHVEGNDPMTRLSRSVSGTTMPFRPVN